MSEFQTIILFVAIVSVQAAISALHSYRIYKLNEEIHQLYARVALLEMEVSDNG